MQLIAPVRSNSALVRALARASSGGGSLSGLAGHHIQHHSTADQRSHQPLHADSSAKLPGRGSEGAPWGGEPTWPSSIRGTWVLGAMFQHHLCVKGFHTVKYVCPSCRARRRECCASPQAQRAFPGLRMASQGIAPDVRHRMPIGMCWEALSDHLHGHAGPGHCVAEVPAGCRCLPACTRQALGGSQTGRP